MQNVDFSKVSLNHEAEVETKAGKVPAKTIFCEGWPVAKQTIEAIQALLQNPIAKLALTIALGTGNALYAFLGCGGPKS